MTREKELIQYVEGRYKSLATGEGITPEGTGYLVAMGDVLRFYENLKKDEPKGLDEAAERIVMSLVPTLGQKYEDGSYVQGTRDYFSRDELIGLVKAGAEWMVEQGETQEHFVIREVADHDVGPAIVIYPDTFDIGDNVIVQIRKKETK